MEKLPLNNPDHQHAYIKGEHLEFSDDIQTNLVPDIVAYTDQELSQAEEVKSATLAEARNELEDIFSGEKNTDTSTSPTSTEVDPFDHALVELREFDIKRSVAERFLDSMYSSRTPHPGGKKLSKEQWLTPDTIDHFFQSSELPADKHESFTALLNKVYDEIYPEPLVLEQSEDNDMKSEHSELDMPTQQPENQNSSKQDSERPLIKDNFEDVFFGISTMIGRLRDYASYDNGRLSNDSAVLKTKRDLDLIEIDITRKSGSDQSNVVKAISIIRNINPDIHSNVDDIISDLYRVKHTLEE